MKVIFVHPMKVIFVMNKNCLKLLKSIIFKARTTFKVLDMVPQIRKCKRLKSSELYKKKHWKLK